VSGFSAGGHYSTTINIIWSSVFKGAGNMKGGAFNHDRYTSKSAQEIKDSAVAVID